MSAATRRLTADDRLAIHELMARAAWGYDASRLDVVASCYASDAAMTVAITGGKPAARVEGRAAVVELIRASIAAQHDQRRHVMSNVFVELDDADAPVVVSTLALVVVADGTARVLSTGTYRDVLAREDGAWRIRRRDLALDLPY
jgi:hypothetical protein